VAVLPEIDRQILATWPVAMVTAGRREGGREGRRERDRAVLGVEH
jgi:hypothetical protein